MKRRRPHKPQLPSQCDYIAKVIGRGPGNCIRLRLIPRNKKAKQRIEKRLREFKRLLRMLESAHKATYIDRRTLGPFRPHED